jgi:hypothetical protein
MAKMRSQNRLLIPKELTDLIKLYGKVGVFWDEEEKKIYLNHLEKEEEFCILVRRIDGKNRICLPDSILSLIKADRTSEFVIGLKNHRIYIFKCDEENGS